ncbi:ER lumen protein retaining receptor [Dillenia turbinata]|uniref:ER lumen protein retaining receptor n=1 Tax=Dillenia turbinata TaxID=194707 RepID=A0AAN8YVI3_9MAGN
MGEKTTAESEGVFGGGCGHGDFGSSPIHGTRSRQSLCRRRGCSFYWHRRSYLQAYEGENLCWMGVLEAGLSLKSQELTAIFLAVRLYCSFVMEYDIHTVLDLATLTTTLWVIYMIRFKLRSSYMEDKDNFAIYYVVGPCGLLALIIHPSTSHHLFNRICWAFCVYLEAVSVLPQLRVMQNTKIVEPFTAHYVFALGVARFLSCAHWVLQVLDSRGHLLVALGYGLWPSMVLISEVVQTFILADFCYYYIKSVFGGQLVLRLPSGVV